MMGKKDAGQAVTALIHPSSDPGVAVAWKSRALADTVYTPEVVDEQSAATGGVPVVGATPHSSSLAVASVLEVGP